jgi:hypothetical protein
VSDDPGAACENVSGACDASGDGHERCTHRAGDGEAAHFPIGSRDPGRHRRQIQGIRDARDWHNPKVVIRAEGIEVVSAAMEGGRKTVPVDELRELLISLPVRAWPYGRVVLAADLGLRRGDGSDDAPIKRNHDAAEKILEALDVVVDWWPS